MLSSKLLLFTIDHDCPVPVGKHGSVKIVPHPFGPTSVTPPKGSKVKFINFAITKAFVNIFAEILHAGRGAIDIKHIKQDFSFATGWVKKLVTMATKGCHRLAMGVKYSLAQYI